MISFSPVDNVKALERRLGAINPSFADIEVEELVLWGDVQERLEKAAIEYGAAYEPQNIPPEQV
jgi:hypothetical protein